MRNWEYVYTFNYPNGLPPANRPSDTDIDFLVAAISSINISKPRTFAAGFTYFGQFIDHDLTFMRQTALDPESQALDPTKLLAGRKPALDLDSIYGGGITDSIALFDKSNGKFILGDTKFGSGKDFFRSFERRSKTALIADERNDENLLVAQMQVLFMRYHNKLVDYYFGQGFTNPKRLFKLAQREAICTYQWIALRNFASQLLPLEIYDSVILRGNGRIFQPNVADPKMSIEFVGAAFRLHSLVLPSYIINQKGGNATTNKSIQDLFRARGKGDVSLFPLPEDFEIDWRFFFRFSNYPNMGRSLNRARLIQPSVNSEMNSVPVPGSCPISMLRRNIDRGYELGLPSGQSVYAFLHRHFANQLPNITVTQPDLSELVRLLAPENPTRSATPLWVYIMMEALTLASGTKLGLMGGWIVADTLMAAFESSETRFDKLRWAPENSVIAQGVRNHPERANRGAQITNLTIEDLIVFTN